MNVVFTDHAKKRCKERLGYHWTRLTELLADRYNEGKFHPDPDDSETTLWIEVDGKLPGTAICQLEGSTMTVVTIRDASVAGQGVRARIPHANDDLARKLAEAGLTPAAEE